MKRSSDLGPVAFSRTRQNPNQSVGRRAFRVFAELRHRPLLALIVCAILSLLGAAACGGTDLHPKRKSAGALFVAQGSRPTGTVAFASPVDAVDLSLSSSLRITIRESRADESQSGSVAVFATGAGSPIPVGAASLKPGLLNAVTVPVHIASRLKTALSHCKALKLSAVVESKSAITATTSAQIQLEPPQCGTFFAPDSIWNKALGANAPLDPDSAEITKTLLGEVKTLNDEHYYPTVNIGAYSVPVYTVGITQPRVPVTLDNPQAYADGLRRQLAQGVPIPSGAQPAAGTDEHLLIWQPGTDTMWELWHAKNENGSWHAGFGGVIPNASTSPGAFFSSSGIQLGATGSALALAGGLMTASELQRGQINHALAFAVVKARRSVWSLPASRSDGYDQETNAIPEGAQFRLPASLNIKALHLPPFIAMMALAVQKYGMVVRDQSATLSFYAQPPTPGTANPYPQLDIPSTNVLASFPWQDLQLVRMSLRTYGNQVVPESR